MCEYLLNVSSEVKFLLDFEPQCICIKFFISFHSEWTVCFTVLDDSKQVPVSQCGQTVLVTNLIYPLF